MILEPEIRGKTGICTGNREMMHDAARYITDVAARQEGMLHMTTEIRAFCL